MGYDILKEYIIHCYLYYTVSESIISDHQFDQLCLEIQRTWDKLESPYQDFVYELEKGVIKGMKGSELLRAVGEELVGICPPELITQAMNRLKDYQAERELFA